MLGYYFIRSVAINFKKLSKCFILFKKKHFEIMDYKLL